jgi:hypothetical protein
MVRKGTIMNQNAQSVSITAPALIYSQETKIVYVVNGILTKIYYTCYFYKCRIEKKKNQHICLHYAETA